MQAFTQALIQSMARHWRPLLMLALIPALQNCSRIDGSVELNNGNGEPYSFEGAKVEIFDLNPSIVLPGNTRIPKGFGSVADDDGAIALQVLTAGINDNALYDVEIRCGTNNATDACDVESALHVVLKGSQLLASGWKANALTEVAFQNIAYYVATAYSAAETSQILENNANALLLALPAGVQKTYDDLLAWSAAKTDAIKRVDLINTISESLAAGILDGDLKVLAQQAVSAELSSLNLIAYGINEYVQLADGYAYFNGEGMPLTIIDIRDPNAIKLDGVIAMEFGGSYTAAGDFLYLAGEDNADHDVLYIYDISNRQQPQLAGQWTLPFRLGQFKASGGYIYSASADVLHVVDATNPAAPAEVGTLSIPVNYLLRVADKRVYVSNASGIHIVDVSTPSAPHVVGSLPTAGNLTIIGDYAYVTIPGATASDPVQLQVFAISNPAAPTLVSELALAAGTSGLTVVGTRAYADTSATVQILDIGNAAAPVLADSFPNTVAEGVRLNDSAFFTFSGPTVSIIDPSIVGQPVVRSGFFAIEDAVTSLATAVGRYAYVPNAFPDEGFKVFDLIDPLAPALITTYSDAHFLSSIAVSGNYAFLGDAEFGSVQMADINNPAAPVQWDARVSLDPEELPGIGQLVVSGNRLFVTWRHGAYDGGDMGYGEQGCNNPNPDGDVGGVFAIDVSAPQSPVLKGHICAPEGALTVTASGNYAYVGAANGSLQVVDFTDAAQPTLTDSLPLLAPANSSAVVGGYLWLTEGDSGIEVFNISNPAAPVLLTRLAVPGNTTSIEIEGNQVYVAAGLSGMHIFDIGNPMLPRLVGNVSTDLPALSAFVEAGYLYAATSTGLEIFKAMPNTQ